MRTHLGIGLFIRWLCISFCGPGQEVNQNGGTVHTGRAREARPPGVSLAVDAIGLWMLAVPVGFQVLSVFALSQWKGTFRTFPHAYGPFT